MTTLLPEHVAKVVKHQKDPLRAVEMFNSATREEGYKHTTFTYRAIVDKLGSHNKFEELEAVLTDMRNNLTPSSSGNSSSVESIYVSAIRSYGRIGNVKKAVDLFEKMEFFGCEPSVVSYNTIMNVLVQTGYSDQMHKVYMRMLSTGIHPDVCTFTIRIKSFCKSNRPHTALRLLMAMPERGYPLNSISFSTVIRGFYSGNLKTQACQLFDDMLQRDFL